MVGPGCNGMPSWYTGKTNLVGILMGHHGACDLLCNIRDWHAMLHIFYNDSPGIVKPKTELKKIKILKHVVNKCHRIFNLL